MSVTIVLHEAERTGAPRIGGTIAAALRQHEQVRLITLSDGPLVPWLQSLVGPENVTVCSPEMFSWSVPFAQRVEQAKSLLGERADDVVYANSAATAPFVVAGKSRGQGAVLHIHEKAAELRSLLKGDRMKLEVVAMADAVVLAGAGLADDLRSVCGFLPDRVHDFGIALDVAEIQKQALSGKSPARNAAGTALQWKKRFTVGMCGFASPRKGADIFLRVAAEVPEFDFIWIGAWAPEEATDNTAYEQFEKLKLPNFYVSGSVANPYQYLGRLGLFFLSSREDPNPLVLAESIVLRIPILCFSATTAVTAFLARSGIMCHGHVNVPDAVRVIKAIQPSEVQSDEFRSLADEMRKGFDISNKIGGLMDLIHSVRAAEM